MNSAADSGTIRKPVIHHLHELQWRLTWAVLAVIAGATLAYSVHTWVLAVIQKPLGQTLYYTSPMGGFNFLFKLCLVVGFVLALPIILYQVFAFLGPLLTRRHKFTITAYTFWSFSLACLGILFAYFISLPSALHFLGQFGGGSIKSLITVDEYFNFALAYLVGFALMFQVPLVILFMNRITPLKPSKMMGAQRYIILFSFIAAAVLTPTPDPFNQTIMALPAVLLYQIGIVLIWYVNRRRKFGATSEILPIDVGSENQNTSFVASQPAPLSLGVGVSALHVTQTPSSAAQRTVKRTYRRSIDGFVIHAIDQEPAQTQIKRNALPAAASVDGQIEVNRYFDIMTPPARSFKT